MQRWNMMTAGNGRRCVRVAALATALLSACGPAAAQQVEAPTPPPVIPEPVSDPLAEKRATDPLVRFLARREPTDRFLYFLARAAHDSPAIDEADAIVAESDAARREALAGTIPDVDLALSQRQSFARQFSESVDSLFERSQSISRTDATFTVSQRVLDFGANDHRIAAATHRTRAARHERARRGDALALESISAWYDVFAMRALVALATSFLDRQEGLREAVASRVERGVSAPGDQALVDSDIASARARAAVYTRRLAAAEARFIELFGMPAPEPIGRAPVLGPALTQEAARAAALELPQVAILREQAAAARRDASARRAETKPSVDAQLQGGRFGLFDEAENYDVRGTLVLRKRLFGGDEARADQADARARQAEARLEKAEQEALRFATTAWSDLAALEAQYEALEESYFASRQSRDVIIERFLATRGSAFDVLEAQQRFLSLAVLYLEAAADLDIARYVLLSRTGHLLEAVDIEPEERQWGRL